MGNSCKHWQSVRYFSYVVHWLWFTCEMQSKGKQLNYEVLVCLFSARYRSGVNTLYDIHTWKNYWMPIGWDKGILFLTLGVFLLSIRYYYWSRLVKGNVGTKCAFWDPVFHEYSLKHFSLHLCFSLKCPRGNATLAGFSLDADSLPVCRWESWCHWNKRSLKDAARHQFG